MRFFETIKNIWTIDELRNRIGITLLLVLVYRLGCYVVLRASALPISTLSATLPTRAV